MAEFPTLDHNDLRAALLQACERLKEKAPEAWEDDRPATAHARAS
jgi:hypothetical protein